MSLRILCLTSSAGIPLFSYYTGRFDTMTFSQRASLNGVHMFLKSHNISLLNTDLPDITVVWKEFEECIILIAIASGITKHILNKFLDAIFDTMVFFIGIDEIKNSSNIEKLKKDVRLCDPIIDRLIDCLDIKLNIKLDIVDKMSTKTDIFNMTECIVSSENHLLKTSLEGFMDCLHSIYGCVLIHDCVAVATKDWWSLDPMERKLLILAITTETTCTTRDIPVFLPHKSPYVAFRLVSITLIKHVKVLALCELNPGLIEIERFAVHCWKNNMDALNTSEQYYSQNIPFSISLDSETIGFLLVNYKVGKFVLGRNPYCTRYPTRADKLDILRTFYHQVVETFALSTECEKNNEEKIMDTAWKFNGAKQTYLCSEYHKCYAIKQDNDILCVLYTSVVPTHTMRLISLQLMLKIFTNISKQDNW